MQKAFGNNPLSIFLMALCTSSFDAETPRSAYRFEISELILFLVLFGKDKKRWELGVGSGKFFWKSWEFEEGSFEVVSCKIEKQIKISL